MILKETEKERPSDVHSSEMKKSHLIERGIVQWKGNQGASQMVSFEMNERTMLHHLMNNNRKNYSKRALTVRYFMTRHKRFYVLYVFSLLSISVFFCLLFSAWRSQFNSMALEKEISMVEILFSLQQQHLHYK